MNEKWNADPATDFTSRWGRSAHELELTSGASSCPDVWELQNGDVAIIGTDLTESYRSRLPEGVSIDPGERLVVIPRMMMVAAKGDIPDA